MRILIICFKLKDISNMNFLVRGNYINKGIKLFFIIKEFRLIGRYNIVYLLIL